MQLSEIQRKAVETLNGQLLLISCPGSGKTSTVIHRVRHMVELGIPADSILVLTFSNAAAAEMKQRYENLPGTGACQGKTPVFSTIHAFCFQVLTAAYGYTAQDILQETERWMIVRKGLDTLRADGQFRTEIRNYSEFTNNCLMEISVVNNNYVDWDNYKAKSCPTGDFKLIYDLYEEQKTIIGKIDFDDMLRFCNQLFLQSPEWLAFYRAKYRYLIVDEYQDTNFLQRDIIYSLAGRDWDANLCVVGDDDQSIYKFRGARPEVMLDFEKDYPYCTKLYMDINYRSEPEIIRVARNLIECNKTRFKKDIRPAKSGKGEILLKPEGSSLFESKKIVERIRELKKEYPYEEMAVLYRNNRQADLLSLQLFDAAIPFHSNTPLESPYKHWIYTDVMAVGRLASGTGTKHDFTQMINKPSRYIPSEVYKSKAWDPDSLMEVVSHLGMEAWKKQSLKKNILDFFKALEKMKGQPPKLMILSMRKLLRYDAYLKEYAAYTDTDPQELISVLDSYVSDIETHNISTLEELQDYAASVNLKFEQMNSKRQKEGVTLSTMHRAKGLEWDVVFIIGANDGVNPSRMAKQEDELEEERRLFYVAVTRARKRLEISWLKRQDGDDKRSRFLHEMEGKQPERVPDKTEPSPIQEDRKFPKGTPVYHDRYGKGMVLSSSKEYTVVKFLHAPDLKLFKGKETMYLRKQCS